MSKEEEVRTVLIGMGIEPRLAHEASTRYQTAEAALNWVFGEGENVSPHCSYFELLPSVLSLRT